MIKPSKPKINFPIQPVLAIGFLVILLSLFSCKSRNKYSLSNLPEDYVTFGHYGGFTGASSTYYIFENGQAFLYESLTKTSDTLQRLKKLVAKEIFKEVNRSKVKELKMNEPGNMSYFIAVHNGKEKHEVVWGRHGAEAPEQLKTLNQLMVDAITKSNLKNEEKK